MMSVTRNLISTIILISLAALAGCSSPFGGQEIGTNIDFILYAPAGSSPSFSIDGTNYTLGVGDKLELQNTTPTYGFTTGSPPTCFYAFFGYGGLAIQAGYDPLAVTVDSGGNKTTNLKYDEWAQNTYRAISSYEVKVLRDNQTPVTVPLQYGGASTIFTNLSSTNSFSKYTIRGSGGTGQPVALSTLQASLGSDQLGTVPDRTICFKNSIDPIIIEVAELPATPPTVVEPTPVTDPLAGPDGASGTDDDIHIESSPIVPVTPEDVNKVAVNPAGPSTTNTAAGTTPVTPTEKSGGSGGCLQLDPNSNTPSTAWVWLTVLCVTGMVLARRKLLAHR